MNNFKELLNFLYQKQNTIENVGLCIGKLLKIIWEKEQIDKSGSLASLRRIPEIPLKPIERIEDQICNLKKQGYKVVFDKTLRTAYRLVVGLGSSNVLETSLTLHHIFGIPYIPGTALKGVVRMVSFWEIAKDRKEGLEDLQEQLYEDDLYDSENEDIVKHKLLFGTQGFKGLLVFLDAYPEINEDQEIFELDIMNVHYKSYYGDKGDPGDWENPNPIIFLTVKRGIPFKFYVLFDEFRANRILENNDILENQKGEKNQKKEILKAWIKKILEEWIHKPDDLENLLKGWIESALKEFGVGAKTRLGYGIFEGDL